MANGVLTFLGILVVMSMILLVVWYMPGPVQVVIAPPAAAGGGLPWSPVRVVEPPVQPAVAAPVFKIPKITIPKITIPKFGSSAKYTFMQGVESPGEDLIHYPQHVGDVSALQAACSRLPPCKGFNTKGYLKKKIKPESERIRFSDDPNQGLYVKKGCIVM